MIDKIKKYLNLILIKLFNIQLVKSRNLKLNHSAKKIFSKQKIIQTIHGYWKVDPMPSETELNKYYESIYWDSREKLQDINRRDLTHFYIIKKNLPDYLNNKCFLNFGAGHGGISHLIMLYENMKIINIDQHNLEKVYTNNNWITLKSLKNVKDNSVDIFYASHSLEHVQSIDTIIQEIKRVLTKDGILFCEVPNANFEPNMTIIKKNQIDIPHTYYFTTTFFKNIFKETILNEAFDFSHNLTDWAKLKNQNGKVIRAIGRLN